MIDYKNPKLVINTAQLEPGSIQWRSPSNIAIIKYWGKHGRQLPRNPSISFTLDRAHTETRVEYQAKSSADKGFELDFYFDGQPNDVFRDKLVKYMESIIEIFPFLRQLKLTVNSRNSFPHSAGIASSASGMSAFALCLCSLEHHLFGTLEDDEAYRLKASYLARLGSGSACRSIYPTMAVWGATKEVENSSDLYAVPYTEKLHKSFKHFHDDILIVSKGEKSVSSRAGHALMEGNIYADNRYLQARQRMHNLLMALQNGDLELFGQITENEALTLHALMMSSNPSYILMQPNTILLIQMIRDFRSRTKLPLYFSLDAGPNLHLLYPDEIKDRVQAFIKEELLPYCVNGEWIADFAGPGPLQF